MAKIKLSPPLYFSYGQFLVYDQSVAAPGCLWTEQHTAQGFARRESTVCFRTLLDLGYAEVVYQLDAFMSDSSYERVIAVPFFVSTGKVVVDGPEENSVSRLVEIANGRYRLTAAQRVAGEREHIELFFEKLELPLRKSQVVVADKELQVPDELLETAAIA